MTHYDLAVIGTGSGNSILDERFVDWRVAILEEGTFGGTCLNVGCIPTKMFVHPADLAREAAHARALGVDLAYGGARWPEIRDRIFARIDPIAASGRGYRERQPNVDVHARHARFLDDHTLAVASPDGGPDTELTADQIVIAAGSRVDVAPIPGLDQVEFHTSDTVMHLPDLPRRMVIVGGGYVAAEFAHVFSALGTEVIQVQRSGVLLRDQDEAVSEQFTRAAARQWDLRLDTVVTEVGPRGQEIALVLSDGSEIETDVLLIATGRIPNGDRLGLENTTIESTGGRVLVDEFQRTSAPGVWALGDISSEYELKHVANLEARTVQHNLLHPDHLVASDHRFVPRAVFTSPQIASVGLTSQAAREQGVEHLESYHDYSEVAYGWALESAPGEHFVKLLGDPTGQRLLGAHIIGPEASLLLQPLVQAISLGTSPVEMARGQYWIHPSLAEVVENALLKMVPK